MMNGWPLKIGDKYAELRRLAAKDDIGSNIPNSLENKLESAQHYNGAFDTCALATL